MRAYEIVELESTKFRLRLYENGLEESLLYFDNRISAEQAAYHFVTEYDGYIPFEVE